MGEKVERVEDRLADFTRDKRVLILSLMALIVGAISAVVAYVLVWLIAVITNISFYDTPTNVIMVLELAVGQVNSVLEVRIS